MTTDLDPLVKACIAQMAIAPLEAPPENTAGIRERFFELMVVILANLYGKTPVSSPLFDRATMLRVTKGMDDGDAGKLAGRTEDWMRIEGLVRQQDGQKAYFLTRPTLAVLSTLTSEGTLGEVLEKILAHYGKAVPSAAVRKSAVNLGSYILTRLARN